MIIENNRVGVVRSAALLAATVAMACSGDDGGDEASAQDLPPLAATRSCTDAIDAVYGAAASAGTRGQIVACAPLQTIPEAEVRQRLATVPGAIVASGDVRVYLVAYRTAREPLADAISSALIYLPTKTLEARAPMVLAAHGTTGLSDVCTPSRMIQTPATSFLAGDYWDALYLAWAARGMPVIAPDYAGLGTEGVHGYDSWLDPARSALDGARALASFVPADRQDGFIVSGHSQGGGIALSTAAYANEAPDVKLRAVVALAPGYRISSLTEAIAFTNSKVTPVLRTVAAMSIVSGYANLTSDASHLGDGFAPAVRDFMVTATTTRCFNDLLTTLDTPAAGYVPPATVGDLVDPDWRNKVLDCAAGKPCDPLIGAWVARDKTNEPHLPASAPPVLVVASTADEQALPKYVGCVLTRIEKDGIKPDECWWEGPTHIPVVGASAAYAIEWALAAAKGTTRPACTQHGERAKCSIF